MADNKLNALTQRIIATRRKSAHALARELHDGISQNLVGVRYAIDLAAERSEPRRRRLRAIDKGVEAPHVAIKEVRRLSHDLRPPRARRPRTDAR